MNIKNAGTTIIVITILHLYFGFSKDILSVQARNQPQDFIDAIIVVDSLTISILANNDNVAQLHADSGAYFCPAVNYDNSTKLISAIQFTPHSEFSDSFKSLVWDHLSNKKWIILEGTSNDGEGYHAPIAHNFSPANNTAIVQHWGYEWSGITYFRDGIQDGIQALAHMQGVGFLAELPNEQIIVYAYTDIGAPIQYFIYSWRTKVANEISQEQLLEYKHLILSETGYNALFELSKPKIEGRYFNNIYWNPDGNAFVYTTLSIETRKKILHLFNYETMEDYILEENHNGYMVIWRK